MVDFSVLSTQMDFWKKWGFEPWTLCSMDGLYRRVTFRKEALLGEVARYYALDYLVWKHNGESDMAWVLNNWQPSSHVVLHRFIFLVDAPAGRVRRRSYWFGLRGFLEIHPYAMHSPAGRPLKDIAWLIDNAAKLVQDSSRHTEISSRALG